MKRILFILLILSCLRSSGQHYFVIPTMNNPETKAQNISRLFYRLSRPIRGTDTTEFLLHYIKHPLNDSIAIVIDSTFDLPKGNINAQHITGWITEVYGTLTTAQRNAVTNYINNNNLLRLGRLIIAARVKLWTKNEMILSGWFNYTY